MIKRVSCWRIYSILGTAGAGCPVPWLGPGLKFKFELFPPMRTPRPRPQQQQYPQPAPDTVCKLAPGPMASRRPTLIWISIKLWIINLHLLYISLYTTALLTGGIQEEGSARLIFNCADMRLFNFHDFKLWIMWILWSSVPGTGVCTGFCLN